MGRHQQSRRIRLAAALLPLALLVGQTSEADIGQDIPAIPIFVDQGEAATEKPTPRQPDNSGKAAPTAPNIPLRITISGEPPPGFEELVGEQTTLVDVFYGNRLIASTMARFDQRSIQLLEAEKVVAAVPHLIGKDDVLAALSARIDYTGNSGCGENDANDCDRANPSVATLLFDADAFRADLAINPRYVERIELDDGHYLPDPASLFSSLHSLDLLLSGDGDDDFRSLADSSILSWGKSRLVAAMNTNTTRGFSLDKLRLEHDRRRWTLALGTMDFSGLASPLVTTPAFVGLRAARTLKMRTNSRLLHSSPIFVYLEERSRVDIFRDGKLLSSTFYDAGNRQLDTRTLPDGAYEIELRISNGRGQRSERHLFTRSVLIPPPDHALHFIETGRILQRRDGDAAQPLPSATETTILHAGSRFRLRDNIGGEVEMIAIDNHQDTLQGGLYYFLPRFSLHGGLLQGNEAATGRYLAADFRTPSFNLGINHHDLASGAAAAENPHPLLTVNSGTDLTVSTTLSGSTLIARAARSRKEDEAARYNYSIKATRTLYRRGPVSLRLSANWNRDDRDERILFSLQYAATEKRRQRSLTTNWSQGPDADENGLQLDMRLAQSQRGAPRDRGKSIVFAKTSPLAQHVGARLERTFPHASGFVETRIIEQDDGQQSLYSAGGHVTITTASSSVAMSGGKSGLAGVMIDLGRGDQPVDIEIDDRSITPDTAAGKALLLLEPYREYKVAIRPRGDRLMQVKTDRSHVTLYPGNVAKLDWQAVPVFVVVGQAVLPDERSVGPSRITNLPEFSATDESGWFQVELASMQVLELKRGNGSKCRINLPERKPDPSEPVIVFDRLICQPLPDGTSPAGAGQ